MGTTRNPGRAIVGAIVLALAAAILLGLLAVDTTAALILIGASVATWLVRAVVVRLTPKTAYWGLIIILSVFMVGVCILPFVFTETLGNFAGPPIDEPGEEEEAESEADTAIPCPDAVVTGLHVIVTEDDLRAGRLNAGGSLTAFEPGIDDGFWDICERERRGEDFELSLDPVKIVAEKRGAWLRETSIGMFSLSFDEALEAAGYDVYDVEVDELYVELREWPRGSFFEGQSVFDLDVSQYLSTETVTWRQSASDRVRFSYLPPATRFVRPLLTLSFRIGSVGEGIVAVGGVIGSLAVSWAFESVVGERIKAGYWKVRGQGQAKRKGK